MIKKFNANQARLRRHQRMRNHLAGTTDRPRLNVFRSGQHIYAQIIDDINGRTLTSASSLDESLRDFKPSKSAPVASFNDQAATSYEAPVEESVAEEASAKSKKGKATKAAPQPVEKVAKKTPVEALAPISNNRKVALARAVGKLLAQRAKEQGVSKVVFDRGGYTYHGRVAALAEGAREDGLEF